MHTVLLALVVGTAFAVETALGFGATVITVSLGVMLMPLSQLLTLVIPLNLCVSSWVLARAWSAVDRRLLLCEIAPWIALGMPVGMWASRHLADTTLKRVLGVLVVALAARELWRMHHADEERTPLGRPVAAGFLTLGGITHGMYGAAGPMVVYVLGRRAMEKTCFRATLAALWLCLNTVLVVGYALDGSLTQHTLGASLALAPALGVGVWVGEVLHRRVPTEMFRRGVYAMLAVVGAVMVVRG